MMTASDINAIRQFLLFSKNRNKREVEQMNAGLDKFGLEPSESQLAAAQLLKIFERRQLLHFQELLSQETVPADAASKATEGL